MSTTQFTSIQKRTMKLQALQVFNLLDSKARIEERIEKLKSRLEEKVTSLESEIATIEADIITADTFTRSKTGYSSEQLFEKVVKETEKLDSDGNPIKRTTIEFKYPDTIIPTEEETTTETTEEFTETTEESTTESTEETTEDTSSEVDVETSTTEESNNVTLVSISISKK